MKNIPEDKNICSHRYGLLYILGLFFLLITIIHNICVHYSDISDSISHFFNTKALNLRYGVDFGFIICGYFLYHKIIRSGQIQKLFTSLWLRLSMGLMFVFVICCIFASAHIERFPLVLTLTGSGVGFEGDAIGWGELYVDIFFWCSCFISVLCIRTPIYRGGVFWLGVLMYLALSLKIHAPYPGWKSTYYALVGTEFMRGFYNMGFGVIAGFLGSIIHLSDKKWIRFSLSIWEVYVGVSVLLFIFKPHLVHYSFFDMGVMLTLLFAFTSSSYGVISWLVNKIGNFAQRISKYAFSVYLGHMVAMNTMIAHKDFSLNSVYGTIIIVVGGLLIGIIEYRVIGRYLFQKLFR